MTDGDRTDEDDGGVSVCSRTSLIHSFIPRVLKRSKGSHDFIPVSQTDGSFKVAAGSLWNWRTRGHWTCRLGPESVRSGMEADETQSHVDE